MTIPTTVVSQLRTHWSPRPDYATDPLQWAADRAPSVHLWSKQTEILRSLVDNRTTAVKSCHNAGKSFTAALATCWWIDSHEPGTAVVLTSAPTDVQVKAILWREINRLHGKLGLPGRTNLKEWYLEDQLVAFGRKPSNTDPTAFQGIHDPYVLVVLDEAGGIPKTLWDAASSLVSSRHGKLLAIGNPDHAQAYFSTICDLDAVNTITIPAWETPNFTGEEVPEALRDSLLDPDWVEEKRTEWTETSPIWIAKIEAEFPSDDEDGVVLTSWASECRWLELPEDDEPVLGFDVSAGGDRSIVWLRAGRKAVRKWVKVGEKDPTELARWVQEIIEQTSAVTINVDAIGVGWGVAGELRLLDVPCQVVPVNVSESADESDKFVNLRAEMWWQARERSRQQQWDLGALDDDDFYELTAVRYHTQNAKQRIQVERKEEVVKRIRRSPDSADALLLAFHIGNWEATIQPPAGSTASAAVPATIARHR